MKRRGFQFATLSGLTVALLVTLGGCPIPGLCPSCPEPNCPEPNCAEPNNAEPNNAEPNTPTTEKSVHEKIFTEILSNPNYEGTSTCLNCHSDKAADVLASAHFKWEGVSKNIQGHETEMHGKRDLINNFCLTIQSNEGRCTACHPSYGWVSGVSDDFFTNIDNVDCLVCHDNTGLYRKHPTANGGGGQPALMKDGELTLVTDMSELNDQAYSVGPPTRQNCGLCHFYAGGGDNVKHGDLSSALVEPTEDLDVHMGGQGFTCQKCHTEMDHTIKGTTEYTEAEGIVSCEDCHTEQPHSDSALASLLNLHTSRVACQTCHIPTFARGVATKLEWYWDEAGDDNATVEEQFGRETYNKKKGRFVWGMNVQPVYRWHNGVWKKKLVGADDHYTEAGTADDPIVLATPVATAGDADAKIYPFKKMIGRQPVDPVNKLLVVPHLFGTGPGENPYWAKFDWAAAIAEGTAYAGQDYSGTYDFANTVAYLSINHEIAPKEDALQCEDCHGVPEFWSQLGIEDPFGL